LENFKLPEGLPSENLKFSEEEFSRRTSSSPRRVLPENFKFSKEEFSKFSRRTPPWRA
jgi:hypothetical protein